MTRSLAEADRLKVLVLSKNYPNSVTEMLGLWVERLVRQSTRFCELKVIAPRPYCPPGIPEKYSRFRRVESRCWREGVEVFRPAMPMGPGYSTYRFESALYYMAVRRLVARLRRDFPFELIHAHFTYPDGVAAVELGKRYRVPVVITEHIPWDVWSEKYPGVLARAARAAGECACHISVSESVRKSVAGSVANEGNLVVVPNGVDGSVFRIAPDSPRRIPNQILFAGAVRPVKGVDVLLGALRRIVDRGRDAKLTIVGEAFFDSYRKEEQRLRQIAKDLALEDRVHFAGKKSPHDLARCMQAASVLVLPSRIESFGAVLLEALACGTPVVATRSGGPEEIVTEQVGVLTPPGGGSAAYFHCSQRAELVKLPSFSANPVHGSR